MCGICGYFSKNRITEEMLRQMNDTMYHRGPNDAGVELYPAKGGYTVGLAQRRLSIMDLSSLGHQPMHSKDGRVSLVFNGEIYNFRQLKEELKEYPFVSNCDTEVIIAAYLKWGIQCVEKLNGMFAISIYDRMTDTMYLLRDRIGKKPLYYWYEGGNLVFASELKPIMCCPGFEKKIRADLLPRYLYQQYISGADSIFENVFKLEPGQVLCFQNGTVQTYPYWDLKTVYHEKKETFKGSFTEAKETLRELLKTSVKARLEADVPVGTFLSGGYDSSLITAIAKEVSNEQVKSFSIGFHEKKYNEAEYAKRVSEQIGCEHTELYIDEKDMFSLVDSIPTYYDEPFADSSQIPSMLVAELAKKDVTVVLSGDGGDELFCGYNVYDKILQAQKLDVLGAAAKKAGDLLHITDRYPFKVRAIAQNRNPETKTQFPGGKYQKAAEQFVLAKDGMDFLPCCYEIESIYQESNWQERRMLLDMHKYLPDDILCKVDRATMKYSLEARCPILDKNIIEFAMSLPHAYKYEKGNKKRILKALVYDYIPRELMERPKVGFSVPLDQWLRGPLREQLSDYSQTEYLKKQNLFDPTYIQSFLKKYLEEGDGGAGTGSNYSRLIWAYYMFQKWYEMYGR